MKNLIFLHLLILFLNPLYGYIGPGMSGGLIATILGIIGSIFLAILEYSIILSRDFLKNRKK